MVFITERKSVLGGIAALLVMAALLSSCGFGGFGRKKYENPISKDTQQPDKVLFDKAVNDIEHGRYEIARLTLQTMINTYDTSEYLAKAKLAVADSWYREGGTHGLSQAEAEYKDFILFYPQMEEAAESQWKVCLIHYKQMEKPERDNSQAQKAEDECRQVLVQFPNSKYVPRAQQMLRNVQEELATKEFLNGYFYYKRQAFPAASARLSYVVNQYPLFSQADEALWDLADSYNRLGDRWEDKAADAYTRIVRDYPLSTHADGAKEKLQAMKRPVPEADPAAVARMKYNEEHYVKASMLSHVLAPVKEIVSHSPDVRTASKTGEPSMKTERPPTPISVPIPAGGIPGTSGGEVTATPIANSDIDNKPDARAGGAPAAVGPTPAAGAPGTSDVTAKPAATGAGTEPAKAVQGPLPTNYQTLNLNKKQKKPKKTKQPKNAVNSPASVPGVPAAPAGSPATTTAPPTAPAAGATPAGAGTAAPKTDPSK